MSEQPTPTPAVTPEAKPAAAAEAKPQDPSKSEQTFTQADVDRIVKERLSREGLADLKAKAAEFDKLAEAQKTAEQRAADALAKAQRDAEGLTRANWVLAAAADHGVGKEFRDLIGGSTAEEVNASAERVGKLLAAQAERDAFKVELDSLRGSKPAPTTVPVAQLRPGAMPAADPIEDDAFPAHWIPQRPKN